MNTNIWHSQFFKNVWHAPYNNQHQGTDLKTFLLQVIDQFNRRKIARDHLHNNKLRQIKETREKREWDKGNIYWSEDDESDKPSNADDSDSHIEVDSSKF